MSGVLGFMGHGDSWGFIFTHESTPGFMRIHGDSWIGRGFYEFP